MEDADDNHGVRVDAILDHVAAAAEAYGEFTTRVSDRAGQRRVAGQATEGLAQHVDRPGSGFGAAPGEEGGQARLIDPGGGQDPDR